MADTPEQIYSTILYTITHADSVGYHAMVSAQRDLEEIKGQISNTEYSYAVNLLENNLKYYYPLHEDAVFIDSISIWSRDENCKYLTAQKIPDWLVRVIKNAWRLDTNPVETFPLFIFGTVQQFLKNGKIQPLSCIDFSISYINGFDPRNEKPSEKPPSEKPEEQPKREFVTPTVNPELEQRIDKIETSQEKIISTLQSLQDILSRISLAKPPQETQATGAGEETQENKDFYVFEGLKPSERDIINRNTTFVYNGITIWHTVTVKPIGRNLYNVYVSRMANESPEAFQEWIKMVNDRIDKARTAIGQRPRPKSRYEIVPLEGSRQYVDSVLKRAEECSEYRNGSPQKREQYINLLKYALNVYFLQIQEEMDEMGKMGTFGFGHVFIDWDHMDAIFFPVSEICKIFTTVKTQKERLERIGETVLEWSGTDEGKPVIGVED
ncbi:MAG: hypothetical protein QXV17_07785 [Candidatus Micrarchaeaceae archaeon]